MSVIKNMHRYYKIKISGLYFLIAILALTGCRQADRAEDKIAAIELDLKLTRFDREFADAAPEDLPGLKEKYPFLFPSQYPDSLWIRKMQDTLQIELMEEVGRAFPNLNQVETDLEELMKHIVYYFPRTRAPEVITLTSEVDYKNRVILADSLLLIGLDNYLGADHRYYAGMDRYIAQDLDPKFLTSDVASAYAHKLVEYPANRNFLARMIYYGKILFLKDKWMPASTDGEKIHYSEEQLAWAEANEEEIWRYFIEKEVLYSTDQELGPRFLEPAPFSKFRLELDNESPGRLGRYVGWKIVRSFMENNKIRLQEMIALPAEEIFKNSKYKPNK
ncbi:MAG: gliding motility lipoprotein GldB [Flavobacteriaceae bacterium]